jgi:N-formylglutamate amidohydrolase
VIVSIPHYGTESLRGIQPEDYADDAYRSFPRGYADAFAAEIYGDLHGVGATVLATPYSRLFVDLNRRRSNYELHDGAVHSRRGVVRTHFREDKPIFAQPMSVDDLEARLAAYYDPYHRALDELVDEMLEHHGTVLVLDGHTGSEKGMRHHEFILGTCGGRTADCELTEAAAAVIEDHGFNVDLNVPGYSGAHMVKRLGTSGRAALHAIQIEINSRLIMACSRREYFERIDRGEPPAVDDRNLERLRACMREVVGRLGEVIAGSKGAIARRTVPPTLTR